MKPSEGTHPSLVESPEETPLRILEHAPQIAQANSVETMAVDRHAGFALPGSSASTLRAVPQEQDVLRTAMEKTVDPTDAEISAAPVAEIKPVTQKGYAPTAAKKIAMEKSAETTAVEESVATVRESKHAVTGPVLETAAPPIATANNAATTAVKDPAASAPMG